MNIIEFKSFVVVHNINNILYNNINRETRHNDFSTDTLIINKHEASSADTFFFIIQFIMFTQEALFIRHQWKGKIFSDISSVVVDPVRVEDGGVTGAADHFTLLLQFAR